MTTPTKPTIVLVPGAWHSPSHYSTLLSLLQHGDYPTTSSRLPSVGSLTPLTATAPQDADFIREKMLLPLLESGKDIILINHSYGSLPGAAAAKGLSKAEREKDGKKGGIIGIIFIAGLVAREGDTLEQMVGGKLDDWIDIDETAGIGTILHPISPLYGDVPGPLATAATAELLPHALLSFRTPSPPSAWADSVYDGRRGYIRCTEDAGIPAVAQKAMVDYSGVEWDVHELMTCHSPQLSMPDKVAEVVFAWAGSWDTYAVAAGERKG